MAMTLWYLLYCAGAVLIWELPVGWCCVCCVGHVLCNWRVAGLIEIKGKLCDGDVLQASGSTVMGLLGCCEAETLPPPATELAFMCRAGASVKER